jgi:DNA-binding NtrC family response regulator
LSSLGRKIQPATAQPSETPAAARNETVLLVEDEPTLRDLAQMLLQELGYQVISASSGLEAQHAWAKDKERIDILLTDLVMPDGVTGFELAQKLQRERPSLKVLLTSGYDPEKVMQDMPASRGFAFIQKPYRAEALARALRQCLERPGQGR